MPDLIYASIAEAEVGIRKWLEGLTQLTAIQPGNQAAVKSQHIMFHVLDIDTMENACTGYTYDDLTDVYQECTVTEHTLTYQVDVMNCNTGPDSMIKILRGFKGGVHRTIEAPLNLAYSDNSTVRTVNFVRHSAQHYKYTVDISFKFRCKECVDINAIETAVIRACDEFPNTFLPELTITQP